jgi:hypothetical protein
MSDIEDIKHKVNDCLDRLYGVDFDEPANPEQSAGYVIGYCRGALGMVLEAIERMEGKV